MTQQARDMMQKTLGQDRLRALTPEERRRLQNDLEKVIQTRGAEVAQERLRKADVKMTRAQLDSPDPTKGRSDLYAIGAAALMLATVHAAFNTQYAQDELDAAQQEADTQDAGQAAMDAQQDPFAMHDPRPSWA